MNQTNKTMPLTDNQFSVAKDTPYLHYKPGQESYCWFCGERTTRYRTFKFSQYHSGKTGPDRHFHVHTSNVSLNIYSCPKCTKTLDEMDNAYEKKLKPLKIILGIVGFIGSFVFVLKVADEIGLAVFLGAVGGLFLFLLSIPIAKLLTYIQYKGSRYEFRKRLHENPEVLALYQKGYTYEY